MEGKCSCKPGNESNGWTEERSLECLNKELKSFGRALETARRLMRK